MSIIINEFRRTTGTFNNSEYIELLLLADQTPAQLESLFFGDSQTATNNKFGTYRFTGLSAIAPIFKAGTLIVVGGTSITQETAYNPLTTGTNDDWAIQLRIGDGFINNVAGRLGDLAVGDVVWVDSSNTGISSLDSIAWASTAGFGAFGQAAKVQISRPNDGGAVEFTGDATQINQVGAYAVNSAGSLGLPNIGNNTTYINTLRGIGKAAGVTITQSGGSTDVDEAGTTIDTYTIALNSTPTGTVTIQLTTTNGGTEVSTDGTTFSNSATLNLIDTNPVTIAVKAIDDSVAEGNHIDAIAHSITSTTDPAYSNTLTPIPNVSVNISDNDTSGITLTPTTGLITTEAGSSVALSVLLNSQPTADVILDISSDNTAEGIVSSSPLTFTPANWNIAQTATVTGVDDTVDEGDIPYNITATARSTDPNYNTLNPVTVAVTNTDNDGPGVIITQSDGNTEVTPDEETDTYEVVLNTIPTSPVIVTIDPDEQTDLGTGAGNPITLNFPADVTALNPQTVTLTPVNDAVASSPSSTITHTVTSTDPSYNGSDVPITVDGIPTAEVVASIPDSNNNLSIALKNTPNNIFFIEGASGQAQLQFTLTDRNTSFVDEVGVFVVDDDQGAIDGIAPSESGYLEAALKRSQVIFSVLPDDLGNVTPTRQFNFNVGERLVFYLVPNSSTDSVLAGQATPVFFAPTSFNAGGLEYAQARAIADGGLTLAWEDGESGSNQDFNDLVLNVQLSDQLLPIGTELQGQRELLDLRSQPGLVANVEVRSEAVYENTVGLYIVEDEQGTVLDPLTGTRIAPGAAGYEAAAIRRTVLQSSPNVTSSVQLDGGILLAPYIIADSTPGEFLASNPNNQPGQGLFAYFAYSQANPDGFDHIRLLGDNRFGFEDLFGGGDQDFNDMILQVNFA